MKKIFVPFVAGLAMCATVLAQNTSNKTETKPLVVVISLDGFPARALQDPLLPMPTLRALEAQGSAATAMRPINPTVTWPNHTAIVTGVDASKHHVMANGLLEFPANGEPEVEPWVDKDKLVHAHTLYEAASEAGMTTAQVDWVAIYGAKGVTWHFGEKPDPTSPIAQDLVKQGVLTQDKLAPFGGHHSSPAWRDEIWTDAAVDILEHHTPNLLLLHLLQTDTLQHEYAPLTNAAYAAYAYADTRVAQVVEAVRKIGALDRTTFFIVSDHGFASYTHSIQLAVGLAQQGIIHVDGKQYTGPVQVKPEGGAAEVFIRDASQRATLVPKLKAYFATVPGVAHVYTNAEARAIGLPAEQDTDQAPQLYLTAASDYAFGGEVTGPLITEHAAQGQHGYLNTDSDMQALFIASGAHIRQGIDLGAITNLRVAPTIAQVLGVSLPDAQDKPLTQILK